MHHERPQHDDPLSHVERAKSHIDQIAASATTGIAAGLISHEVRNLLTPAIAYVQVALREPSLQPEVRRTLAEAATAMRRACEVSELVLACYRPTPPQTDPATSNVGEVLDDCLQSLGLRQPGSSVVLTHDVPPHLEALLPPEALRHVLLNVLLNAQASFRSSGGAIWISSSPGNTDAYSTLAIRDSGRGIPADQLRLLNRELNAPPAAGARSGGGGGLGLVLCRHLLEPYGAHLTLESVPGRGTTATLSFQLPNKQQSRLVA
jgi:signal transduction histidine kinase